jgi:hypothetical protein
MEAATDRSFAYLPAGVWISIYDLARIMHRTVQWVRKNLRDKGRVPHTRVGDTEFFWTDDVIRFLDDEKTDPSEGPLD